MLELGWRRAILSPAQLSQRLQLRRGMSVLELGAGSGFYSRHVVEQLRAGRLVLLDLQVEMLSRNRARCDDKSVASVLFIAGDATNVPLVDASVDLVFMVAVFGEIPNQAACLSEIARVLRPEGILSISEHLPDPDFCRFSSLCDKLEQAGFVLTERRGPPWAYTASFRRG